MTTTSTRRATRLIALALALGAISPALAQTTRPATTRPDDEAATWLQSPLAGPVVAADARGPAPGGFGGAERRNRAIVVPVRRWFEVINELGLTEDQKRDMRAIVREFQQANRQFNRAHGEELKQLGEAMRAARQGGPPPDEDARARFAALRDMRPKPEARQQRIWALLSEAQRDAMCERLDEIRREIAESRLEQRRREMNAMMAERDEAAGMDDGGPRRRPDARRGEASRRRPASHPAPRGHRFEFEEDGPARGGDG